MNTDSHPKLVTPEDKPSLVIRSKKASLNHAVGFIFPNGSTAIKAGSIKKEYGEQDGFTEIGVVEIGEGAEKIEPGIYTVEIDLTNPLMEVEGRLKSEDGKVEIPLQFVSTPLTKNEARSSSDKFPLINPVISADGVSFVITAKFPGSIPSDGIRYFESGSMLSVKDNFPTQFEQLQADLDKTIALLTEQGFFPDGMQIDLELTISEMEDPRHIKDCNENGKRKNKCGSDIIGAPSSTFWADYESAKEAADENFSVPVAVVKVLRRLKVEDDDVQPGDYLVMLWFDAQEAFLGATLRGLTDEGHEVDGQPIPATPAYFLDQDDPHKIVSWISAWHVGTWCLCWQSNCP